MEPKKRGRPPGSKNKPSGIIITPKLGNMTNVIKQKIEEQKAIPPQNVSLPQKQKEESQPKKETTLKQQNTNSLEPIDKTSDYKNYRHYSPGERIRHINTGEYGYVKTHKAGERYVYINWGGDYMYWLPVDLLELAEIKPKKSK